MANNLYKTAFSVGFSEGKYKSSMYDVASSENLMRMEDMRLQFEQNSLNKNVGFVADTLALASAVAGRAEDISDDVSVLEGEYGEMERPEGIFGRMMQSTKMGFGLGEYKFGNEVISAKDIAVKSSQIKYKSMLDEAMSNISPSNIKELSKPNIPIPESEINWDDFMLGDQEVEPLDFDSDSNEIDFNKPYKMSIIK
mgnify:CR=1 FL=1|tara:strand:- start:1204 stop:1794 length:591 start_codon:yes stop_codon:yes gene_type:complete